MEFSRFSRFSGIFQIYLKIQILGKTFKKTENLENREKIENQSTECIPRLRRVRTVTQMVPMFWYVACGAAAQHPRIPGIIMKIN